jgi:methionine synthase II (cobalamin-independent)
LTDFSPNYWTTVVGSFPHLDAPDLCARLVEALDVPDWPQLPRRSFRESMYVQFSSALPGVVVDESKEKIYFDTSIDLTPGLESFYEKYLADDVDSFSLPPNYAAGFYAMLEALKKSSSHSDAAWVKGQITGPISFGLTVTDQTLRASLYNEMLADAIVKNMVMQSRWQIRKLKQARSNVFIFVDEPYMASFGSAFISLERQQVIDMLDEVFEGIQAEGALAGVHCCANTDWSVLLATRVDILNLDAYGYLENLALYPNELRAFLDRGGVIAWGIVPNNEEIYQVKAGQLAERLRSGFRWIQEKALARGIEIHPEELDARSLIAPSCGLGPTSIEVAEKTLEILSETSRILQQG